MPLFLFFFFLSLSPSFPSSFPKINGKKISSSEDTQIEKNPHHFYYGNLYTNCMCADWWKVKRSASLEYYCVICNVPYILDSFLFCL